MKFEKGLVAILVFAVFTIGAVESLLATPEDSQRLRGLGGRTFEVMVQQLDADGEPVSTDTNCYTFEPDGAWIDSAFPGPAGTWVQHSNGASTTYTAEAEWVLIPGVVEVYLVQEGTVTPAQGSGVLQLEATSIATGVVPGLEFPIEFYSIGFQNEECEPSPR